MNAATTTPVPAAKARKRRGVVLVAVLVVIVLLSLAGYQYNEMMLQEYKVSEYAHRSMQSKALADSGIHYAAGMLSNENNFYGLLGGNPFDNPELFKGKQVQGDDKIPKGFFTLIAPPEVADGDIRYGVMDESGKININALMEIDKKDQQGGMYMQLILSTLPVNGMTPEIASSIVCWMYPGNTVTPAGAMDDYYMGRSPAYRTKGGPIDSLDELLLVKDVTRDLLYGTDSNRNGSQDEEENAAVFDRGLSAYVTVHSREPNYDPTGKLFVYLMMDDLTQLSESLKEAGMKEEGITFLLFHRTQAKKSVTKLKSNIKITDKSLPDLQSLVTKKPNGRQLDSVFSLIEDYVVEVKGNNNQVTYQRYVSPFKQQDMLEFLFKYTTLWNTVDNMDATKPPYIETPARININTASEPVLKSLTASVGEDSLTKLTPEDITTIMLPKDLSDPVYQTPAWLYSKANISIDRLKGLDKWITTHSQVFRVQSVGYFEGKGPAIRVEAVIDTNNGRPRILAYRNLTDLGKGWNSEKAP